MQFAYHIEGMHCESCVGKIKAALSPYYTVNDVTLNPPLLKIEAENSPSLTELNTHIKSAGKYSVHPIQDEPISHENHDAEITGLRAYYPIFLIAAYIIGVAFINNMNGFEINWHGWMYHFMAGFFLVFSAFKFLDLNGFADGYATYDLLARHWHTYGYIYPFLELSLGILYLAQWIPTVTLIATIIIMGFSSIGVINSLIKKQKFQCACLGTIIKVPLSSVTLIEDLTMVVMAVLALLI